MIRIAAAFGRLRLLLGGAVLHGGIGLGVATTASASERLSDRGDRPNIVILLADDLSRGDLGCYGQRQFRTPAIDRLAAEGRRFTHAFAGGAWCAPSRTALLTGRSDRFFGPRPSADGLAPPTYAPTLANVLQRAGYATAALGKWHMAEPDDNADRTVLAGPAAPWHRGFDVCRIGFFRGWNYHFPHRLLTGDDTTIELPENHGVDEAYFKTYYGVTDRFTRRHRGEGIYDGQGRFVDQSGRDIRQLRYSEAVYREEAVAFMRANRHRPFFLYFASTLVHAPIIAPSIEAFKDRPSEWTTMHKAYAASVEEFDRSVGTVVAELRALGLEGTTIVLVMSDNGYTAGFNFPEPGEPWGAQLAMWDEVAVFGNKGPWNRGKHMNTAGGLVVPFVAWGPGRVAPGVTDRSIWFPDVMPTVAALTGAPLLAPTEGVNLLPLLSGQESAQPPHPPMVWSGSALKHASMQDDWAPGATPSARPRPDGLFRPDAVLLDERWFAMRFVSESGAALRLFDLRVDPGQLHDVAAAHPEWVARAQDALAESRER